MIAAIHHTSNTRSSTSRSLAANDRTEWPIAKVVDRIALFEQQVPFTDASSCVFLKPQHKTIADGDASTVRSFLHSIGQDATQTLPPKLWRLASEWRKRTQERTNQRKQDNQFYSLSEDLDRLDAILYSDCTLLEIESINLVASSSSREEEQGWEECCHDDDILVNEENSDTTLQLTTLESGIEELAEELELFK